MCLLPLLGWAELALRGPLHLLIFKDLVLESLCSYFFLFAITILQLIPIFSKNPLLSLAGIVLLVAILNIVFFLWHFQQRKRQKILAIAPLHYKFRRLLLLFMLNAVYYLFGICLSIFWWLLCTTNLAFSAVAGTMALGFFLVLRRIERIRFVRDNFWILLSLFAISAIVTLEFNRFDATRLVPCVRLFNESLYDAVQLKNGNIVATKGKSVFFDGRRWNPIERTHDAQRLIRDPDTDTVYIANRLGSPEDKIVILRGTEIE